MAAKKKPRMQCAKCPWKKSTDPNDIPGGYCETKHKGLERTIARPGIVHLEVGPMMACHEYPVGKEKPCVGWMIHQLGPGNNIALRIAERFGKLDANVRTVGAQHERFEDTLPTCKPRKKAKKR